MKKRTKKLFSIWAGGGLAPSAQISRRAFAGLAAGFSLIPLRSRAADAALAASVAGPARTPKNIARDRYRHPLAALAFFGLRDDEAVLEIEPGAGYWTEILAPYLKAHGRYIAAVPLGGAEQAGAERYLKKLFADADDYGQVTLTGLATDAPLAPANSVDLILSFRNLHDWLADGTADAMLREIHAALKPGGVFGIEDHRGLVDVPQDPKAKDGYVREDYATALIEHAGFRLIGVSQIGDNPRDTKNYPHGVWTLPPVLRMGAVDRDKYLAIGESDRWTLKFRKV